MLFPAAIGLAACANPSAPAEPGVVTPPVAAPAYRMQAGDVLTVKLTPNPELNEEVTVRPDGRISTTLARDEMASGRTVPELNQALDRAYARTLKNPHVTVVVKSFAPTRVYVGGEVNSPGEVVNADPGLTVSRALTRAGGVKGGGDEAAVFIIRRGPNNVPAFLSTRYGDFMHGKDAGVDIVLAPYDVIYVPKTDIAEVRKYFNQYVRQFALVHWGFSYAPGYGTMAGH